MTDNKCRHIFSIQHYIKRITTFKFQNENCIFVARHHSHPCFCNESKLNTIFLHIFIDNISNLMHALDIGHIILFAPLTKQPVKLLTQRKFFKMT